jgi:hypothetical protein
VRIALSASGLSATFLNMDVFLNCEMKASSFSSGGCGVGATEKLRNDIGLYARVLIRE